MSPKLRSGLCVWFAAGSIAVSAQQPAGGGEPKRQAALAESISLWVADYERERLSARGPVRSESGLQPRYVGAARADDLLTARDLTGLTHLEALQKLLYLAEGCANEPIGEAVLGLAAAGLDKSLIDRDALLLRDLGHCALLRMEHQGIWFLLLRLAAGQADVAANSNEDAPPPVDVARRVAAIKLLGCKGVPVFRSTVEHVLTDIDPRIRLAGVEALELQRRAESVALLLRCVGVERHPVVAQAAVRALLSSLRANRTSLPRTEVERTVGIALRAFGTCGWRTDMELLDLVEEFPVREAVPYMIGLLEPLPLQGDQLVSLVNKNASPMLRNRAYACLRAMTGAIFTIDQTQQWRDFWRTERDRIQVPERLHRLDAAAGTRATFFGIAVTGSEIAFVIDTSGSMDQQVAGTVSAEGRRSNPRAPTRLSSAKEQLLLAVQSMDPASHYHLLTFADDAQVWSRKAVPPSATSTRSLTELLSRLQARGATNIYDGLVQALALEEVKFGATGSKTVDELFLLSDGEPTAGVVRDPEELLTIVRAANKYLKVRINTVFTGEGGGADFLRRLAEENGGVFVQR